MARKAIREIIETWKDCEGNYSKAARRLGIDRRTVRLWVRQGRQPRGYVGWKVWGGLPQPPNAPTGLFPGKRAQLILLSRRKSGVCSEKLAAMANADGIRVSVSTIQRWCAIEGLLRRSHRRRRPLFQNGRAMRPDNTPASGYLQMDVKDVTPELSSSFHLP
ncbi:MAG: helix-turn-helix domain-containing protein [Chloroflexi bacterium]|nr:helix-turn-helix domain-containing protein [Chloroflexota bacterium]